MQMFSTLEGVNNMYWDMSAHIIVCEYVCNQPPPSFPAGPEWQLFVSPYFTLAYLAVLW